MDYNGIEEFQSFGEHYGMFILHKKWEERKRFQTDFDFWGLLWAVFCMYYG